MKKIVAMLIYLLGVLAGCLYPVEEFDPAGELVAEDYINYRCYDYHLACLDAYDQVDNTFIKEDVKEYSVYFRKPVGTSDGQFVCARVANFLGPPNYVIFQNPDDYVNVLEEWTIKKIELYYIGGHYGDENNTGRRIGESDEPAAIPTEIIATCTEPAIFSELVDFVLNPDYSGTESYTAGYYMQSIEPKEGFRGFYIRIHFNESSVIVWDSDVSSNVHKETGERVVTIDKGRAPQDFSSKDQHPISIENQPQLFDWITHSIDEFKNK